jgi:hypothetical protein
MRSLMMSLCLISCPSATLRSVGSATLTVTVSRLGEVVGSADSVFVDVDVVVRLV